MELLVHGPESTNVIDIVRVEDGGGSTPTIRKIQVSTFQIVDIGPHNYCESSICEQRSMVGNHCGA
jgi:hypothetical protein